LSLLWRYMSSVQLDNNADNPLLFGTTYWQEVDYHDTIGSYSYFDSSRVGVSAMSCPSAPASTTSWTRIRR
jgi:hypothetical protein